MSWSRHIIVWFLICSTSISTGSACAEELISPEAADYLKSALDTINSRSLMARNLNWKEVQTAAFSIAQNAKTPKDTYPAILYALKQLDDHHSFFKTPSGKIIVPYKTGLDYNHPQVAPQYKNHIVFSQSKATVGLLIVRAIADSSFSEASKEYANDLVSCIRAYRNESIHSWIVDLRLNNGGNMWPMLAGLGAILEGSEIGSFESPSFSLKWYTKRGEAGILNKTQQVQKFKASDYLNRIAPEEPVAVLIGHGTASAGEAIAIAFKGRKNTLFFGESTNGQSTGNEVAPLSDGSCLVIASSVEADRTGVRYFNGIQPDFQIPMGNSAIGSHSDPVLNTALHWLLNQQPCPLYHNENF